MSATMPYIPEFKITPRRFTLHNSAPEPFVQKWAGLVFTIPAVDIVGPKAAEYDDGSPIPGTLVLQDSSAPGRDGTIEQGNWKAEDTIRNVLGINLDTGQAEGMAALAGISFVPNAPSRETLVQIRTAGELRWHDSQVQWAEHETAARMAALELAKEHGTPPPTPSPDYRRATLILERYYKKVDETFGKSADELVEAVTHEDEIEMEIYLKAAAIKMAEKVSEEMDVDKNKVAEEMLADPKIRKHLQKKFSIRKKGHTEKDSMPVPSMPAPPQSIDLPDHAGEPPGEG